MTKNRKKGIRITIISLFVVVVLATTALFAISHGLKKPVFEIKNQKSERIYIRPATMVSDFITEIEKNPMTKESGYLSLAAKLLRMSEEKPLKPGCYKIDDKTGAFDLMKKIRNGEQAPVRITLNNLRLPEQFAARTAQQLMPDSAEIMNFVTDKEKMGALGFKPEELFVLVMSNSYEMWWTSSIDNFMKRMKTEHEKFWNSNGRQEKAKALGLSISDVVILASIVDEESNHAPEKSRIAGLYINRLKRGIPLQSDPTIKYAMKQFELSQILYSHLETDSPYNTYKYKGLPPGPIRMPSTATIDAVLDAESHDYIYMCADERLNGTHKFAKTLSQHNANAAKYHAAYREWKRKSRK